MVKDAAKYIEVVPFNDADHLERVLQERGREIACLIMEPAMMNIGIVVPQPGYLQRVRELCTKHGVVFIFDEIKTGFTIAPGGATERFGVQPDLVCLAKAISGGLPAAAFGGRAEVMSVLPDKVSHGGTYAGNRVAAAAAVATLKILRDTDALATIHQLGRSIQAGLAEVISERGLPYVFTGHPAMFGIMFTEQAPNEYRDWANSDHDLYDAVAFGMHARGAMPEPDSREPWFLCEAHAREDIVDRVVSIFADSLDAALDARAHGEAREVESSQWSMGAGTAATT